jgi:hypothetical protein
VSPPARGGLDETQPASSFAKGEYASGVRGALASGERGGLDETQPAGGDVTPPLQFIDVNLLNAFVLNSNSLEYFLSNSIK